MSKKVNKFVAEIIDWNYIYILCPHCVKNSNKFINIQEQKNKGFKRVYHIYNTNDNYKNRTIKVKSNCLFVPRNTEIEILINPSTMRIYK